MSFYVDTQLEALSVGLAVIGRPDLANLASIEEIEKHTQITLTREKVSNILDVEGRYASEIIFLEVEKTALRCGSAPFRAGFDVWIDDPKSGVCVRWNP